MELSTEPSRPESSFSGSNSSTRIKGTIMKSPCSLREILKGPSEEVHIHCYQPYLPSAAGPKEAHLSEVLRIYQKHPRDLENIFSLNVFHWDTHCENLLLPPEAMQYLKKVNIKTSACGDSLSRPGPGQFKDHGSALRAILAWIDIGFHANPDTIDISFPSTLFAYAVETVFALQRQHLLPWFPTVSCEVLPLDQGTDLRDEACTAFHMALMEPLRASATFETANVSGPSFLKRYVRRLGPPSSVYVGCLVDSTTSVFERMPDGTQDDEELNLSTEIAEIASATSSTISRRKLCVNEQTPTARTPET